MKVGYCRVSTIEQNEERQIQSLKDAGCEKIFSDKCSGKDTNRPGFTQMMEFIREGDVLYVSEFSRLGRSTKDLLNIIEELNSKDIHVISQKEDFNTSTPQGKLMLTFFAGIATFERELMLQRQREGIEIAKAKGKYKGRQEKKRPPEWEEWKALYDQRKITATELAKRCKVSRPIIYKWFNEEQIL